MPYDVTVFIDEEGFECCVRCGWVLEDCDCKEHELDIMRDEFEGVL